MCGRYVMARATGDLVHLGGALDPEEELQLRPSWNVAPTTSVPILVDHGSRAAGADDAGAGDAGTGAARHDDAGPSPGRQLHVARWGLVPPWAKDVGVGVRAFNARSETVAAKPTFRAAVRARRCAVPMDGYYEWQAPAPGERGPDGKPAPKRPHFIHPATAGERAGDPDARDVDVIWCAGLYEWWHDPAGDAERPWVLSTTILTMPAPDPEDQDPVLAGLGRLHDRLPVPLATGTLPSDGVVDAWLSPEKLASAEDAERLVGAVVEAAPGIAAEWSIREVGRAVGNVRNNTSALVEPADVQDRLL
ncbi:MAG: SOS response-associated peptidase [Micrococcus sp.]|nr:SOS response-associated peptidase [Micrococcus sp.]